MTAVEWQTPSATILLDPARARVLQVSVGGHDAFWRGPEGAGGDRLWLGPEWAWYWPDLSTYAVETHVVQPEIDPGEWETEGASSRHEVTVRHLHGGGDARVRVSRTFAPVDPSEVPYACDAAYEATATLELLDPTPDAAVSLWALVQVPPGGTAVVPGAPEPRDFFDPSPPGTWRRDDGVLEITLGGDELFKLGVAPTAGAERYAYARAVGDGRHLVVARSFRVEPDARYVDVPLSALESPGDAVQFFCDGGRLGDFSEVEHHSPAATAQRPEVSDTSLLTVSLVDDWPAWRTSWLAAR